MADKIFIGNCKAGKYPDQVEIGFTKDHIALLTKHLNEKGWVNARLNKGKDSGKPYLEIVTAQASATPIDTKTPDDLPF